MDTLPAWQCTWCTGPDAGATIAVAVGRHIVGRAPTADVRCDDPALQPHHALLEVRADGSAWIGQLTGRSPVRARDRPVDGTTELTDGAAVEIGGSVLVLHHRAPALPAASIHAGRLVRSPRAASAWSPADLTPPDAAPRRDDAPGGLVPAMLGLAGAGLIALLLRQPMFLLFGALGGLVAVGSWVAQRLAARRRRRRDRADQASAAAAFVAALDADRCNFLRHHVATVPTIAAARRTLLDRTDSLWSRRAAHHDAYVVSLGTGEQPWRTMPGRVAYCADEMVTVSDLPVPADLGPGARLAVAGPLADAVARALLMQLVASCGPADLRIVVITGRPAVWDCVRGLPHVTLPDGTVSVVDEHELGEVLEQLAPAESAHVLLVTDSHSALATRTSQLRRALGTDGTPGQRFGLLAVLPSDVGVPHMCSSVLTLGNGPTARWVADSTTTLLPIPVRIAGLGERATFQCSAAQHDLQDPEDPLAAARRMPRSLAIGALLGAEGGLPCAEDILRAWQAQGADPAPHTALGMAADGIVDIDLVRDGPHGLIAGTTGAGKSELLRTLVVGMAAAAAPTHLTFVLVDYKGGATFDACKKLPHVVGLVTDLDDHLADRALRSLHAELRRREAILRDHGAADLSALRAAAPAVMLPRLVVVIDEFAALVSEQPSFLHALVGVAQRGRSLGVHLLLATQRPHGVISDDIRANTNLRLALRLHDVADAIDVVGERTPAQLPRGVPGRAVMRLGPDDHVTFQTAHCTVTDPEHDETELVRLVREIVDAAARWGAPDPPAPWQPPLTEVLSRDDVPVDAIGVCDDPDRQRTVPLRWEPGDGSIVVAGSSGSGVTATLHTLAAHSLTVDRLGEPAPHVYVLDSGSDDRYAALAGHPRAEVVRLHERERLMRLLHRLRDHHRSPAPDHRVVLLIDGLDVVRRALDDTDLADLYDALDELLCSSSNACTVVAAVEHPGALPTTFLARCAHRWVLHLHDPIDAAALGATASQVPPAIPGRVFIVAGGMTAQLVEPGRGPTSGLANGRRRVVPRIDIVPAVVPASTLPDGRHGGDMTLLPLGTDFTSGNTCILELPDGEHVMLLGTARSGRSTTLTRLTEAWRSAHPGGRVLAALPRRSLFDHDLADTLLTGPALDLTTLQLPTRTGSSSTPTLVVVDDAELVDDPGGVLASFAAAGHPDHTVVAAGRAEAVRQSYGHWTTVVRRSRIGIVSAGSNDIDGDLIGAVLPRRLPVAPRPGLAWVVQHGVTRLVQVASRPDSTVDSTVDGSVTRDGQRGPRATRLATR